ncbi:MAG: sugar phosphate isomerase/epimerase [Thermodesulfobacteriota bacterium]
MPFSICFQGDPEQRPFLSRISSLKAGLELQSFGRKGIQSQQEWDYRLTLHREVIKIFQGPLAVHGPFTGMRFNHIDVLINEAINKRMDMTYSMTSELKATTVILHTGYSNLEKETEFDLLWLKQSVRFWKEEIKRWESKGIRISLENHIERDPNLMIALVDEVKSSYLGLCFDIGHCNLFSSVLPADWISKMGHRLFHVHLHDNDGTADQHLPVGKGKIRFQPIFKALSAFSPNATLSLEAQIDMESKVNNLEYIINHYVNS